MTTSSLQREPGVEPHGQAEKSRLATEEQYHALADAMPQIVWTARPDGRLDYYNRRWFDYTGITLDETEGRGWVPVLFPRGPVAPQATFSLARPVR